MSVALHESNSKTALSLLTILCSTIAVTGLSTKLEPNGSHSILYNLFSGEEYWEYLQAGFTMGLVL
jgi:hypothetical protein